MHERITSFSIYDRGYRRRCVDQLARASGTARCETSSGLRQHDCARCHPSSPDIGSAVYLFIRIIVVICDGCIHRPVLCSLCGGQHDAAVYQTPLMVPCVPPVPEVSDS